MKYCFNKVVKNAHHNFPEPKVTSLNCLVYSSNSPKLKHIISFIIKLYDEVKHQIHILYMRSWNQQLFGNFALKKTD